MATPALVGHVLEAVAAEVPVEGAPRLLRVVRGVDRQRVHEVEVDAPVVVVVEGRDAAAHRLHDELLLGRGVVLERDPGLRADVAEERLVRRVRGRAPTRRREPRAADEARASRASSRSCAPGARAQLREAHRHLRCTAW